MGYGFNKWKREIQPTLGDDFPSIFYGSRVCISPKMCAYKQTKSCKSKLNVLKNANHTSTEHSHSMATIIFALKPRTPS